jgi:GNAT superfamily N-acetyltransferase
MPQDEIGLRSDPAYRTKEIEHWLSTEFDSRTEMLLIAQAGDRIVGFVAARLEDKDGLGATSKIPLLYIDRTLQGAGIGRRLLLEATSWIEERKPGPVVISAFEQNPFRGFYNMIGGQEAKRIMVRVDKKEWPVILYFWPSVQALRDGIGAPRSE